MDGRSTTGPDQVFVDGDIGGDLGEIDAQVARARHTGLDSLWTTETAHDPFLPLLLAAERAPELTIGTAVAIAFARSPMTLAAQLNQHFEFRGGGLPRRRGQDAATLMPGTIGSQ